MQVQHTSLYCTLQILRFILFLHKLKVCGNPVLNKSNGTIFPTAFVHFMSLYHILGVLIIFQSLIIFVMVIWALTMTHCSLRLAFLAMKLLKIKVCTFFLFKHKVIAHLIDYSLNVNITFMCTRKPKNSCNLLYCEI